MASFKPAATTPVKIPGSSSARAASSPKTPQSQGRRKKRWFAQRDSIERRMRPGRPGTPRYQRYLNRCFLLELEQEVTGSHAVSDTEETECEGRFVNVFGRGAAGNADAVDLEESFFEPVMSTEEARQKWAPFLCIDLDDQESMLASLSSSIPHSPLKGSPGKKRPHYVSNRYWEPLQRGARNAHYWDFICCLEVYVEHYLHVLGACERQVDMDALLATRFVEEGHVVPFGLELREDGPDRYPALCLILESSFHRLLCHGLCSYYQLLSDSCNQADGTRMTQIRLGTRISQLPEDYYPSFPKSSLAAHLLKYCEVNAA